jgi:hypothetical protein
MDKKIMVDLPILTQEEKDKFANLVDFYVMQIRDRCKYLPEGKLKSEMTTGSIMLLSVGNTGEQFENAIIYGISNAKIFEIQDNIKQLISPRQHTPPMA